MVNAHTPPFVSIIVPNYNKSHFLKRCIDSILAQTYPNFEIIIVDNRSTDDSIELLSSITDNRLQIYFIDNEGIIARSRNLGVTLSKFDLIAFCDSDDFWLPTKLESQIRSLTTLTNIFSYTSIALLKDNSLSLQNLFAQS